MKEEMKLKWKKFKEVMKNPPPERIYEINMQQHLLNAIGITLVCGLLIWTKEMWWLLFAFVFNLFGCYTGYVMNRSQYNLIISAKRYGGEIKDEFEEIIKEISPSRRRSRMIKAAFGSWSGKVGIFITLILVMISVNPMASWWYNPRWHTILLTPALMFSYLLFYILIYYFLFFLLATPVYTRKKKEWERIKKEIDKIEGNGGKKDG